MEKTIQYHRTSRDIIQACWTLLKEENFNKITVKQILDKAMISRSTFYQHFSDKYEIIEYVEKQYLIEFMKLVNSMAILSKKEDTNLKFDQIDKKATEFFEKNNEHLKLLFEIDETDLNFRYKLRKTISEYISNTTPNLNELELALLSAQAVEYIVYYINHTNEVKNFARTMIDGQITVFLTILGININSTNGGNIKEKLNNLMINYPGNK
ncbi:TetR/AcrR family transcriptional regulator [Lactobacillus hamsteri]|uniref:HTH tetR-type domain-containing protein n=1 Tax=Lactobacillus hamsteri DSM 5661 = JCM 6256 TaxID=1423754 RepID=A0A0R1YLG8_9LACO|nr:TetR/AcrR family transcriptional regulator [Lactobacillus hamsteri]KRM40534.1 hypothetical protein FC39_GL000558 [Lactobacillus hamsteri DSM 5661 = JCM 6256]